VARYGLALLLVLAYAGSYHHLSRRGLSEGVDYGVDGFLYVPFQEAQATEDLSRHLWLARFYAPANWVDRRFFGGAGPVECIMWRIRG